MKLHWGVVKSECYVLSYPTSLACESSSSQFSSRCSVEPLNQGRWQCVVFLVDNNLYMYLYEICSRDTRKQVCVAWVIQSLSAAHFQIKRATILFFLFLFFLKKVHCIYYYHYVCVVNDSGSPNLLFALVLNMDGQLNAFKTSKLSQSQFCPIKRDKHFANIATSWWNTVISAWITYFSVTMIKNSAINSEGMKTVYFAFLFKRIWWAGECYE